jgi:YfiH family protein
MIPGLVPVWDAPANVAALSTTRRGGTSLAPYDDGSGSGALGLNLGVHVGDSLEAVAANRALLRSQLPGEPGWLTQVHGSDVVDAREAAQAAASGDMLKADACVSTEPGIVCVIQTADCLPVLFCDRAGRVVGAAHAGWRGLANGVLENTVARMRDAGAGAGEILAWLGPAIGPSRFEVGEDVFRAFVEHDGACASAFMPRAGAPSKYLADIYALAKRRLAGAGVDRVWGGNRCTVAERDHFYSYRRDGVTGRMASLIWLK